MRTAVVIGAGGGLGKLVTGKLLLSHDKVVDVDRDDVDLSDSQSIADFALALKVPKIDTLVYAAGVNEINWLEKTENAQIWNNMAVNAFGFAQVVRELLPGLEGGTVCAVTSNAAHMPMTCSIAYNASKAAQEMMVRQMARELFPRYGITVFGVAPNKLSGTGMSQYIEKRVCEVRGWTPEFAAEYQRKSLPAGEETTPEAVADFMGYLLSSKERHKFLNGCIMQYGV